MAIGHTGNRTIAPPSLTHPSTSTGVAIHHGTEYVTQKKSFEQRRRMGRSLRDSAPLESHGEWEPTAERPDPVSRLHEDDNTRVSVLVPVRYERMLQSPFAFLWGAAAIMADDLATTPNIGVRVQTCGYAHLGNFGIFATPERNLHFDITDFDETLPAPWEWDIKRLAVSVQVAADSLGMDVTQTADSVAGTVRAYRERMRDLAELGPLEVWYDRIEVQRVLEIARQRKAKDLKRALRGISPSPHQPHRSSKAHGLWRRRSAHRGRPSADRS